MLNLVNYDLNFVLEYFSRSNGQRNIRCFPSCSVTHNENNFCGKPLRVVVAIKIEKDSIAFKNNFGFDKICVVGEYKLLNNQPNSVTKPIRGAELGVLIKSKKNMHRKLYWGKLVKKLTVVDINETTVLHSASFDFNSELRGWHYPVSGRFKGDEQHCFSVSVLSLNFPNLNSLANLRDATQMENMFENDIFYPLGHFDSPVFKFGLFRSGSARFDTRKEGEGSKSNNEINDNDDERNEENSQGDQITRSVTFESGVKEGDGFDASNVNSSSAPTPVKPPAKKTPRKSARTPYDSMIFGLPCSIFEGIDYSPEALRRFGFSSELYASTDSSTASTASFLSTLPKNSIISTIVKGKLPTLQHSRILFPPPPLISNQNSQVNPYRSSSGIIVGGGSGSNIPSTSVGSTPILINYSSIPVSQRIQFQQYPLINIRYILSKYTQQPEHIQHYIPSIYRIFQPISYYDIQSFNYKTQFINHYQRYTNKTDSYICNSIPYSIQKITIDFWQNKLQFPIAIEPIILYFYFEKNTIDQLLIQNRLAYIIQRSTIAHSALAHEKATTKLIEEKIKADKAKNSVVTSFIVKADKETAPVKKRGKGKAATSKRKSKDKAVDNVEENDNEKQSVMVEIEVDEMTETEGLTTPDEVYLEDKFEQIYHLVNREIYYIQQSLSKKDEIPRSLYPEAITSSQKSKVTPQKKGKKVTIKEEPKDEVFDPSEALHEATSFKISIPPLSSRESELDFPALYSFEEVFVWLSQLTFGTAESIDPSVANKALLSNKKYDDFSTFFFFFSVDLKTSIRLFFERLLTLQSMTPQQLLHVSDPSYSSAHAPALLERMNVRKKRKWLQIQEELDENQTPPPLLSLSYSTVNNTLAEKQPMATSTPSKYVLTKVVTNPNSLSSVFNNSTSYSTPLPVSGYNHHVVTPDQSVQGQRRSNELNGGEDIDIQSEEEEEEEMDDYRSEDEENTEMDVDK